ncbi:hypothetical protein psal_cds_505 [Pandoravirus salinus]|uniref:Uncharacterized protein n=1 Tax=Pandoravirus salinus TaxID=1349410 RepID=S4W1J1_9VIRU|nr:hypothetical protein psal_cds_505 [Pandoravirus salinus]AGO84307.1 hypothetical protein psal_cds_505 [Pandoravirus salinus]
MLLRAAQAQAQARAEPRRSARRASPTRRVRAVAAPPQLEGAARAARFGPGGTVHIDDGTIARYASFVDGSLSAASLLPDRTATAPREPLPPSTPAPRTPAAVAVRRGVDQRTSLPPGTPRTGRPPAAPSPPTSPPLLAPPRRHIVGRSPIDDHDGDVDDRDDDQDDGDIDDVVRPEELADRVAACVLALVTALVVGQWKRARS